MFTAEEGITLDNLGDGAMKELFQVELDRVLKDILDLNTEAKAVREVNIKVVFKPDEERDLGATGIKVTSKLAGSRIFATRVSFGRNAQGQAEAKEVFSGQQSWIDGNGEEKVIPMEGRVKE